MRVPPRRSVEVHHELTGSADSPVLMLSGPVGSTLDIWEPHVELLAERFRVLRYDHRGHGRSPVPSGPYESRIWVAMHWRCWTGSAANARGSADYRWAGWSASGSPRMPHSGCPRWLEILDGAHLAIIEQAGSARRLISRVAASR